MQLKLAIQDVKVQPLPLLLTWWRFSVVAHLFTASGKGAWLALAKFTLGFGIAGLALV